MLQSQLMTLIFFILPEPEPILQLFLFQNGMITIQQRVGQKYIVIPIQTWQKLQGSGPQTLTKVRLQSILSIWI